MSAKSNDGGSHTVSVYSDISAEWVTGNNGLTVNWSTTTGDLIFHQVQLEAQAEYSEISDRIQRERSFWFAHLIRTTDQQPCRGLRLLRHPKCTSTPVAPVLPHDS